MKNILYRADCKEALKKLIDDDVRVDLIYLDPPFNSSRIYNMVYNTGSGKVATQKAFHDMWSLTSQNKQLLLKFEEIIDNFDDVSTLVKNFLKTWIAPLKSGAVEDQKMLVYLIYMTERLILMRRILKDTGSLYYHCDPTASHYIKIILDGLFGRDNFRNEIVWCYSNSGRSQHEFSRKHDIILFFSKSKNYYWDYKIQPSEKYLNSHYTQKDNDGRMCRIRIDHGKERIYYPEDGITCNDWWADIPSLNSQAKERLGYPTQKPITLLDRIIRASCPKDGLVLDPFCGCGTTIASAIKNNVSWIGIDISYDAVDVIKERIKNIDFAFENEKEYEQRDGSPETLEEYKHLNPYQKQDWLIQKLGGFPNPKKSGDRGIDGELTIHLGIDEKNQDKWGKVIFSVKTGKQAKREFISELKSTLIENNADIGILILDKQPSFKMENQAENSGTIKYFLKKDLPPHEYNKIQIITSEEIIDGLKISIPPTMLIIKKYRESKERIQLHL